MEGAWYGPFPLEDARDCRIRLKDGEFDLTCEGAEAWVGAGSYSWHGPSLRLEFTALTRRGELVRPAPAPMELRTERRGNSMRLQTRGEADFQWVRTMGKP